MEAAEEILSGNACKDGEVEKDNSGIGSDNTDNESKLNITDEPKDGSEGQVVEAVAKHYNELQESGLASRGRSRIFYLRNFNNWIKSVLIGKSLLKIRDKNKDCAITVLDLCSGKGGDILKWKIGQVKKLVFVDIAETSVEQCKMRYEDMKKKTPDSFIYDAVFLTADVTKQRLKEIYPNPDLHFDLVSCQFAFHYSFESYPQADMMLKNASEQLRPGGYFIGTTPNCYELVKQIRAVEGNSFGNEVYEVKFKSEDKEKFPLFGSQYWFHLEGVVDCPEFLLYFPVFEEMAKKYGLQLLFKKSFADFYKENTTEKINDQNLLKHNRELLWRMQALESYSNKSDGRKNSNQKEYECAKNKLNNCDSRYPPEAGTLSQSEWEVIKLYLVFMFEKVNDGKESTTDDPQSSDINREKK